MQMVDDGHWQIKDFLGSSTRRGRRVYQFLCEFEKESSDFASQFHSHLSLCREIGRHRNRIVHSAHIHLEGGGELRAIIRSDMTKEKGGGDIEFDQEHLTARSFDVELRQLAEMIFALGIDLRQLIAWRR
jgi:hypothetical protein